MWRALKSLDIIGCMGAAAAPYSCPADRRLVQAIRLGKLYVKKDGAKK